MIDSFYQIFTAAKGSNSLVTYNDGRVVDNMSIIYKNQNINLKRFDRHHKSKSKLLNVSVINISWNRESRNNLKKTEKRGKEKEREGEREKRDNDKKTRTHLLSQNVQELIERERKRERERHGDRERKRQGDRERKRERQGEIENG